MSTNSTSFARASRGFGWAFTSNGLVLLASLLAQFVLGRILSRQDFGVYALAISFSGMLMVFRDGGVTRWLSRMTPEQFDRASSRAMALAFASSLVVTLAVALIAFPVGSLYGQSEVTWVMLVMAVAFPVNAYTIVALAKLHVDLRFKLIAQLKTGSGIVRYAATIALAMAGFGAMSFAWPLVAVAVFELFVCIAATRLPFRFSELSWKGVAEVFGQSKWSLWGAFASALMRQCDYAVLGLFVATDTLGAYYFAFQLAMQPVNLFGESMRRVILPVFSRLEPDSQQESNSLHYVGVFISVVATPGLLLLAVSAGPVIEILWGPAKWANAVLPLQLLCIAMPLHLLSIFAESLAQSRGRFRLWTSAVLIRGIGLGACAAVAPFLVGKTDIATIAVIVSFYLAISGAIEVYVLFRRLRLSWRVVAGAFLLPYAISTSLACIFIVTQRHVAMDSAIVSFVVIATAYVLSVLGLFALLCPNGIRELVTMVRRTLGRDERPFASS